MDAAPLMAALGQSGPAAPVTGSGTLGAAFLFSHLGCTRFAKTNSVPQGRMALEKEAAILRHAYGELLGVETIETEMGGNRLWLVMDSLSYPADSPDPAAALELIAGYGSALQTIEKDIVPTVDNFGLLLREADEALSSLTREGALGADIGGWAGAQIALLVHQWPQMPPRLCHGDLGPRNIMTTGSTLVAIDWEDAFWGFEGYDYLYWLTFMAQRKYYRSGIFGQTPWGRQLDIAILAVIVVLKCRLSVLSGDVHRHQLSFDQRLQEIAALD